MKTLSLVVILLSITVVINAQTLKLEVSSGSNKNWIAVRPIDATLSTSTIEIKQASASVWTRMTYEGTGINTGYWTYNDWSKAAGFDLPLSFRLTGSNGVVVPLTNSVFAFPRIAVLYDTLTQYVPSGSPTSSATVKPTTSATAKPTTSATAKPTTKPGATVRPTVAATAKPTTSTTAKPTTSTTAKPTTSTTAKPTTSPTTKVATTRPTTAATARPTTAATVRPTIAPTRPSAGGGGCSAKTKMLVPLYVYPGAAWDQVAAGARSVKTVAIINPSSGPGGAPDSTYQTYMQKLHDAGVDMVGYVYTSYGARALSAVKADVDTYASHFPLVKGIFLDEGANTASQLSFYKNLHSYIMGMPGYEYNIINPGVIPDSGYVDAATQIVTLEDYASSVTSAGTPSYASCQNKEMFSAIVHTASASSMQTTINNILSKGYFGYVYVTDGAGGCCTYNQLASYYTSMASYIATR